MTFADPKIRLDRLVFRSILVKWFKCMRTFHITTDNWSVWHIVLFVILVHILVQLVLFDNIWCQFQFNLFKPCIGVAKIVLLSLLILIFLICNRSTRHNFCAIYSINWDITGIGTIPYEVIYWMCCQDILYTLCWCDNFSATSKTC